MPILHALDPVGDRDDGLAALLEPGRDERLDVGLFLEDEGGEERDDFFGRVGPEGVLEDELGEDEFVGGVDLCGMSVASVNL